MGAIQSICKSPGRCRTGQFLPADKGFTHLTIRSRSHTLPLHMTSEIGHECVRGPGSRTRHPVAATQP
jgi:hypothetical protein